MRKNLSLFLLLVVFAVAAGFVFTACAPESKNRLSENTATVSIDPINPDPMSVGSTVQFIAIVRNNRNDVNTSVSWHVEPSTLGTIKSNGQKTAIFTATQAGTGVIVADVSGIKTSVNITVN